MQVTLDGVGISVEQAAEGLDVVGVLFALAAGVAWAAYIHLSVATGSRWPGVLSRAGAR